MNNKILQVFLHLFILSLLVSCSAPNLTVSNAWARAAGLGETSAIYFEIDNPSNQADSLISAETDAADIVEIHLSQMNAEGVMTMQHQHEITIPANSQVTFAPGEYHIMLMGLKRELKPNDTFTVKLTFKRAGTLNISVVVKNP